MLNLFANRALGALVLASLLLVAISLFLFNWFTNGMDAESSPEAIHTIIEFIWPLVVIWIVAAIELIRQSRSKR